MAIESCAELVTLGQGIDGKTYYTSLKVLKQERDLIDLAGKMQATYTHRQRPERFEFMTATLNDEQLKAFKFILAGHDLSLLVGFAGTGKSYLMDAVREVYEASG